MMALTQANAPPIHAKMTLASMAFVVAIPVTIALSVFAMLVMLEKLVIPVHLITRQMV